MILLTATRLDVYDQVRFIVEPDEASKATVTRNPVKVAKVLSHFGVDHPLDIIDFVLEWGVVEIANPASGKAEE
jgi:hypothetical protein